jgi:endogenous inhibitor of DNA gyrase (YacG/DUF329 family)
MTRRPARCLECGTPIHVRQRGRPRLWCSDRCRKRFGYLFEYVICLGLDRRLDIKGAMTSRVPDGQCLRCGLPLRRTGYRPRLYCSERCRSVIRRARAELRNRLAHAIRQAAELIAEDVPGMSNPVSVRSDSDQLLGAHPSYLPERWRLASYREHLDALHHWA